MPNVLIVEDEILVACDIQAILEDEGYACLGIAPDLASAETYIGSDIDVALVDLNLRDGLTGPEIGRLLGSAGVPVIFVTANPAQIGEGVAGTIGVITKPTDPQTLVSAVSYALGRKSGIEGMAPPPAMRLFN